MDTGGVKLLAVVGVVVAVVLVLDRLAQAAEQRGWRGSGRRGSMGLGVMTELQQLLQPANRHVAEEQQRRRLQVDGVDSAAPMLELNLDQGTATFRSTPGAAFEADPGRRLSRTARPSRPGTRIPGAS